MIKRALSVLGLAVALAAVPAVAAPNEAHAYTPYNYFSGGMNPGGLADTSVYDQRLFNNMFFNAGPYYRVRLIYSGGLPTDTMTDFLSPISMSATYSGTLSFGDCYRYTGAMGGTGYRTGITCRTTHP